MLTSPLRTYRTGGGISERIGRRRRGLAAEVLTGFAVPAGLSSPGRKSVRVASTRSSARLRPTRLPWTAQWSSYGTRPPSATRFFAHVATFRGTGPVEWPPHEGLHRERHGGRRRHLELAAGRRRRVP